MAFSSKNDVFHGMQLKKCCVPLESKCFQQSIILEKMHTKSDCTRTKEDVTMISVRVDKNKHCKTIQTDESI